MKRLTIIRHAQAVKNTSTGNDFRRPLDKWGKRDADLMAEVVSDKLPLIPDRIEVSPAKRTKLTAKYFIDEWNNSEDALTYNSSIYEGSETDLLRIIHGWKDDLRHCVLIGHNPGLTSLANHLAAERPLLNIPSCGVVSLTAENPWKEWKSNCCKRDFFLTPEQMGN